MGHTQHAQLVRPPAAASLPLHVVLRIRLAAGVRDGLRCARHANLQPQRRQPGVNPSTRNPVCQAPRILANALARKLARCGVGFGPLLRHKRQHTEGHLLFMLRLMIEKHLTFAEAHQMALNQVGR